MGKHHWTPAPHQDEDVDNGDSSPGVHRPRLQCHSGGEAGWGKKYFAVKNNCYQQRIARHFRQIWLMTDLQLWNFLYLYQLFFACNALIWFKVNIHSLRQESPYSLGSRFFFNWCDLYKESCRSGCSSKTIVNLIYILGSHPNPQVFSDIAPISLLKLTP